MALNSKSTASKSTVNDLWLKLSYEIGGVITKFRNTAERIAESNIKVKKEGIKDGVTQNFQIVNDNPGIFQRTPGGNIPESFYDRGRYPNK
jgi:hypothetical protein